jgi:hypothetical protein
MRKEVQNDSCRDSKFLAQEERLCEFAEAFSACHKDQFVHPSALEEGTDFVLLENTHQFQTPRTGVHDRLREFVCWRPAADNSDVAHIEGPMLLHFQQNDSIRNKKDVIDYQRKQDDQSVGRILSNEELQGSHDQAGKTYRLRKPENLLQRRQGWLGINSKNRQQNCPRWKDDCKDPQVYPKGHEGVPFHFEQQTKAVSQKETRRRQSQIREPLIYGEDSLPLVNHDECAL